MNLMKNDYRKLLNLLNEYIEGTNLKIYKTEHEIIVYSELNSENITGPYGYVTMLPNDCCLMRIKYTRCYNKIESIEFIKNYQYVCRSYWWNQSEKFYMMLNDEIQEYKDLELKELLINEDLIISKLDETYNLFNKAFKQKRIQEIKFKIENIYKEDADDV